MICTIFPVRGLCFDDLKRRIVQLLCGHFKTITIPIPFCLGTQPDNGGSAIIYGHEFTQSRGEGVFAVTERQRIWDKKDISYSATDGSEKLTPSIPEASTNNKPLSGGYAHVLSVLHMFAPYFSALHEGHRPF